MPAIDHDFGVLRRFYAIVNTMDKNEANAFEHKDVENHPVRPWWINIRTSGYRDVDSTHSPCFFVAHTHTKSQKIGGEMWDRVFQSVFFLAVLWWKTENIKEKPKPKCRQMNSCGQKVYRHLFDCSAFFYLLFVSVCIHILWHFIYLEKYSFCHCLFCYSTFVPFRFSSFIAFTTNPNICTKCQRIEKRFHYNVKYESKTNEQEKKTNSMHAMFPS